MNELPETGRISYKAKTMEHLHDFTSNLHDYFHDFESLDKEMTLENLTYFLCTGTQEALVCICGFVGPEHEMLEHLKSDRQRHIYEFIWHNAPLHECSNLNARLVGKRIKTVVLPVSFKKGILFPKEFRYTCQLCDSEFHQSAPDLAYILSGGKIHHLKKCGQCQKYALSLTNTTYRDLWQFDVNDNLQDFSFDIKTREAVSVFYEPNGNEIAFPTGVTEVVGKVVAFQKVKGNFQNMCIVADSVKPSADFFTTYNPTKEDEKDFHKFFCYKNLDELSQKANGTIAPFIRGRELLKSFVDIGLHSKRNCGSEITIANVAVVGDSRVAKSEIVKDAIEELCPCGSEYIVGETASRTGVAYSIDTSGTEPKIRWGALVAADGMAAGLDGLNAWSTEHLMEVREVLSQKRVTVKRFVQGMAWARTRILAAANTQRKVKEYPTRYQAAMSVFHWIDRNRLDFILVAGETDVSLNEIDKAEKERATLEKCQRSIPQEIYRKHLAYVWQNHPVEWENGAFDTLTSKLAMLRRNKLKGLDLLSNEFTKKAKHWSLALAQRDHSFREGTLVVKKKHVLCLLELVALWLDDLDIDSEIAIVEKAGLEDVPMLVEKVCSVHSRKAVLMTIAAKPGMTQTEVNGTIKVDRSTVSRAIADLRNDGLLGKDSKRLILTELGAKVVREIVKQQTKQPLED